MPNVFRLMGQYPDIEILGDGQLHWVTVSTPYQFLLTMMVKGASYPRFRIRADGQLAWGTGGVVPDVTLSRRSTDILNTPDRMEVGTLGVGNSESAATPGICQKKIEVFDTDGNSLGFLAVYGSITMSVPARIGNRIRGVMGGKLWDRIRRRKRMSDKVQTVNSGPGSEN